MEKILDVVGLKDWGILNLARPLIIAGPCSAETEEQVLATARLLANKNVSIYRAGIWKPRTRPGTFEGVGAKGLPWLKKVKQETGMLVATEVANAEHVHSAIKYGIDILWVGARTSVNPFAIQEIADALEGADIPVIVKNPVNPDLELWIGALERINKGGIRRLAALHRGFSGMENSIYRNEPQWSLPLDLRRKFPHLPLICDPSHIAGRRDLLFEIAQKAMDLSFDGLMIETHISPNEAWSDSKQQVTPDGLFELLGKIKLRNVDANDAEYHNTMEELRTQIDQYDDEIIRIFGKRMEIAEQIGKVKKTSNTSVFQQSRWDSIVKSAQDKGIKVGLSNEFIDIIFKAIHEESINRQRKIMND